MPGISRQLQPPALGLLGLDVSFTPGNCVGKLWEGGCTYREADSRGFVAVHGDRSKAVEGFQHVPVEGVPGDGVKLLWDRHLGAHADLLVVKPGQRKASLKHSGAVLDVTNSSLPEHVLERLRDSLEQPAPAGQDLGPAHG